MSRLDAIFSDVLDDLQAKGLRRSIAPAAIAKIDVSSNDYLGLARHPLLIGRAREWAASHGTGARASRLVVGTLELHEQVEAKLARLKGTEAALLFASGWQANAGGAGCVVAVAWTGAFGFHGSADPRELASWVCGGGGAADTVQA